MLDTVTSAGTVHLRQLKEAKGGISRLHAVAIEVFVKGEIIFSIFHNI